MIPENVMRSLVRRTPSKIVLLVLDGLGGIPHDGRTELEAADVPYLNKLAAASECGLSNPIGRGITPGSGCRLGPQALVKAAVAAPAVRIAKNFRLFIPELRLSGYSGFVFSPTGFLCRFIIPLTLFPHQVSFHFLTDQLEVDKYHVQFFPGFLLI